MDRFGEKLKIVRKRQGLTMRALAEALGIASHGSISDWEQRRSHPSATMLEAISRYFDVSLDVLMKDEFDV